MELWHITVVTHNSRVSQRMVEYKVKAGKAVVLDNAEECFVANEIATIVREYDYRVHAFNICADHVHMLLECEAAMLNEAVKNIKAISSM